MTTLSLPLQESASGEYQILYLHTDLFLSHTKLLTVAAPTHMCRGVVQFVCSYITLPLHALVSQVPIHTAHQCSVPITLFTNVQYLSNFSFY